MARVELIMPKMGESIIEATILNWVKQEGDTVEVDDTILEIATDKVDSEVPSPVAGTIMKILFPTDEVVAVGEAIAIIETNGQAAPEATPSVAESGPATTTTATESSAVEAISPSAGAAAASGDAVATAPPSGDDKLKANSNGRFYSPLVRNIAREEGIGRAELDAVPGTGKDGRVNKADILAYIEKRKQPAGAAGTQAASAPPAAAPAPQPATPASVAKSAPAAFSGDGNTEIIEMDRMRRLIADHMVMSKATSPHVTSFIEADVTEIVEWRNRVKGEFQRKHGEKITFTPIFIEAVAKAITDFPLVNVSVEGTNIIRKRDINIGMAAALPSGNLIVPVIKQADQRNLLGLTKAVNDLAARARENKLKPEEIQGGTFTLTNVGTFGNVMGTPIINQPQVAILAVGAIRKKPAVVETEFGDLIAVRHLMFLSLSYDHRVVDGFLGGSFLRRIGDYLEAFDGKQGV